MKANTTLYRDILGWNEGKGGTPDQTIEGDKIISEFMGATTGYNKKEGVFFCLPGHIPTYLLTELKYYSSWDWLMPVVQKCFSLCNDFKHPDQEQALVEAMLTCNLSELWDATVKFINWYHKQTTP